MYCWPESIQTKNTFFPQNTLRPWPEKGNRRYNHDHVLLTRKYSLRPDSVRQVVEI